MFTCDIQTKHCTIIMYHKGQGNLTVMQKVDQIVIISHVILIRKLVFLYSNLCVYVCVCVCVCTWVHACMHACVGVLTICFVKLLEL